MEVASHPAGTYWLHDYFGGSCATFRHTACSDTDDELDASEIQSMTINRPPAPIIAPSGGMLYANSCSKVN